MKKNILNKILCKIGLHKFGKWQSFHSFDRQWQGYFQDCTRPNCEYYNVNITHRPKPATVRFNPGSFEIIPD